MPVVVMGCARRRHTTPCTTSPGWYMGHSSATHSMSPMVARGRRCAWALPVPGEGRIHRDQGAEYWGEHAITRDGGGQAGGQCSRRAGGAGGWSSSAAPAPALSAMAFCCGTGVVGGTARWGKPAAASPKPAATFSVAGGVIRGCLKSYRLCASTLGAKIVWRATRSSLFLLPGYLLRWQSLLSAPCAVKPPVRLVPTSAGS